MVGHRPKAAGVLGAALVCVLVIVGSTGGALASDGLIQLAAAGPDEMFGAQPLSVGELGNARGEGLEGTKILGPDENIDVILWDENNKRPGMSGSSSYNQNSSTSMGSSVTGRLN